MSPIIPFPAAHPGMFSPSAEPWEYIMWVVCILTRTPSLSFTHTRANTYTRVPASRPGTCDPPQPCCACCLAPRMYGVPCLHYTTTHIA